MPDSDNLSQKKNETRLEYMQTFIGQSMKESLSPVGRWLDGKLLDIQEGTMRVEFAVREDMSNPMGVLHGGIAATILDDVVGTMVYALGKDFVYTSVNLNCDFLHAAKTGEIIIAEAKVVRAGKNIIHVEGVISNPAGLIIAKCSSNLIQTGLKIPDDHR